MRLRVFASLLAPVLLGATLVRAEAATAYTIDTQQARRNQSLMGAIMSPFCPGKTIDSCPSPRAEAWRRDIRTWVQQGASGAEIRLRLQARVPGFDLSGRPGVSWDWALPVGAMAFASLWLVVLMMRLRREPNILPGRLPETPRDTFDDRLDRELRF